jgi:CheY-like chemotaxis protein
MSSGIRILCVDDDADIRTIAAMALSLDQAVEVRTASSGTEALAVLQEGAWKPDVVLLDVMMPGMDGPAALAAIRALDWAASLPLIFMTARARKTDIDAYLAAGAAGVIVKPFDPLHLAEDVRAMIARAG